MSPPQYLLLFHPQTSSERPVCEAVRRLGLLWTSWTPEWMVGEDAWCDVRGVASSTFSLQTFIRCKAPKCVVWVHLTGPIHTLVFVLSSDSSWLYLRCCLFSQTKGIHVCCCRTFGPPGSGSCESSSPDRWPPDGSHWGEPRSRSPSHRRPGDRLPPPRCPPPPEHTHTHSQWIWRLLTYLTLYILCIRREELQKAFCWFWMAATTISISFLSHLLRWTSDFHPDVEAGNLSALIKY